MAVGKGSMARASRAAGKVKAEAPAAEEIKITEKTEEIKVDLPEAEKEPKRRGRKPSAKKTAEAATVKTAEETEKPAKKTTRKTTKKTAEKTAKAEVPAAEVKAEEPKTAEVKTEEKHNGTVGIGKEMPIFYY